MRLVRGDTRIGVTITVKDPDSGLPVFINDSELRFTVRPTARSTTAIFEKTSLPDGGIVILDDGSDPELKGKARISFTADDWADYSYGTRKFPWDLEEIIDDEPETIAGTPLGDEPIEIVMDVSRAETES